MLLIDGVKYELWTPSNEDEFERVVKEHAQDIFGEQSIYLDRKQKLKSLSGIGSIPDGYVIIPGGSPQWHIIEVELSSHPLHDHIVAQVGRFIGGISNQNIQRGIVNAIDEQIRRDDFFSLRFRKAIEPVEVHRFLTELVSKQPIITIIIEKETEELREALNILRYAQIKVIEFKTFAREDVGLTVHAHLFEPIYEPTVVPPIYPEIVMPRPSPYPLVPPSGKGGKARKVTFEELVSAGLLRDGQVLYFYNTRSFTDERAQVIASLNQLKYEGDGRMYSKSALAKKLQIKHDFSHSDAPVQGPLYWKTEDDKFLSELEEQVRVLRGERL